MSYQFGRNGNHVRLSVSEIYTELTWEQRPHFESGKKHATRVPGIPSFVYGPLSQMKCSAMAQKAWPSITQGDSIALEVDLKFESYRRRPDKSRIVWMSRPEQANYFIQLGSPSFGFPLFQNLADPGKWPAKPDDSVLHNLNCRPGSPVCLNDLYMFRIFCIWPSHLGNGIAARTVSSAVTLKGSYMLMAG